MCFVLFAYKFKFLTKRYLFSIYSASKDKGEFHLVFCPDGMNTSDRYATCLQLI